MGAERFPMKGSILGMVDGNSADANMGGAGGVVQKGIRTLSETRVAGQTIGSHGINSDGHGGCVRNADRCT